MPALPAPRPSLRALPRPFPVGTPWRRVRREGDPPAALWLPVGLVAVAVAAPVLYLVVRAASADAGALVELLWRARTAELVGRTLALAAAVAAVAVALAAPLAWLAARGPTRTRGLVTVVGVLPLAVPGYVMAYALLGLGGEVGLVAELTGTAVPRLRGFGGALAVLGLTTMPYLFLNLRAALLALDPAQEEAARSLGAGRRETAWRIVAPQLRPALLAGGLLVTLHVLGDFGVVSLMGVETLSLALYLQYAAAYDRTGAAVVALVMVAVAGAAVWAEARLLGGRRLDPASSGARRRRARVAVSGRAVPLYGVAALVVAAGVALPVGSAVAWWARGVAPDGAALWGAALDSASAAAPAAALAAALAVPLALLGVRYGRPAASRVAFLGYATPPLALALAFVVFALRAAPILYQTLTLLVVAYAVHFLAEALGPVRSALLAAPRRLEDAARALGRGPLAAFASATLPALRPGLGASVAFVFLAAMKELPMAFLLAPLGFDSLALRVWRYATEGQFAAAAPYALVLIACATGLAALVAREEP